jgi:IS30 family transposase
MKIHTKIRAWERDKIANLLSSKISVRSIAKQLGRSHSSILAEIKRNSFGGEYRAIKANDLAKARNITSRRTNPLKDPAIYSYVLRNLRRWSPEEIAGRLRRKNKGKTVICHETIYHYVHSPDGKRRKLFEYLVRRHKVRRKWFGRHKYRRGIPDRVSIDLRPKYINSRKRFGHWEVDSVEGKAHKKGIHTFLERKTRYYQGKIIENIDSEFGIKAQLDTFKKLPPKARKSATFDNGRENFNHTKLNIYLGMKTYFCDPNCAWQKGANEHFNGVLRRYIPKRTDLTTITQLELDSIVEEINDRPLKCLKYETPSEAFKRELKSITN